PLWKAILTVAHNRQQDWEYIGVGALFALIIAMPAILFPKKPLFAWISLAVICLASYITMLSIIPQFGGVSGGDPYDYLSIAKSIQHGHNPFLNTKRLPGYPLLLVPTVASEKFDDQFVMRIVTSTAGIVGVLLIALIAQTLTNSWPVSLAAAVILAFQKDYIWTAMRPEPYAVYTALLLLALYFFLLCYKKQSQFLYIAFGLSLGYAAMTRQEGFVLGVVLGICSLLYEIARGKNISRFFLMYLPAFAVILPFFITNAVIYHNPFYIKYLEDDRLQIVNSFLAFQDALGATWGIIGSMWKTSWDQLERLNVNSAPLMAGIIGLWGWYSFNRFNKKKTAQRIITGLLLITILFIVLASVYLKSVFSGTFTQISAGFVLASIPIFLIETKWKGLVILLVALSQIGIATWFHPFPKHYEQSYPIIIAMISTALLARVPKRGLFTYSSLVVAILPFLLIGTMLGQKLNTTIDKQNANTALDSVTYRAARYARALPQPIGFDQAYLPARFYFDPDAKYFPPEDNPTPKMEQDWLAKNPLKTIVVTNAEKIFQNPYPNWTLIKTFKAAGDDDKIFESWIYSVH
ncbi:MAG TPA: glycosyltransferase family 39 protein, partial [Candidatus Andersenbacteria bacterium]|nr:glycosyltransferase family 39 protein [Candidatus Andersenbacteria bacterium]